MPAFDPYTHVIKPMLAESRQTPFDSKDHIFELKWDGTRALAVVRDGLRFQNRRLSYVESRYPDLAVHTRKPAILDGEDRKSTRLNSSHSQISYADFCLKIKPYKVEIYITIASGTYLVTDMPDFLLNYSFSFADYAHDNSINPTAVLPLANRYQQHDLPA